MTWKDTLNIEKSRRAHQDTMRRIQEASDSDMTEDEFSDYMAREAEKERVAAASKERMERARSGEGELPKETWSQRAIRALGFGPRSRGEQQLSGLELDAANREKFLEGELAEQAKLEQRGIESARRREKEEERNRLREEDILEQRRLVEEGEQEALADKRSEAARRGADTKRRNKVGDEWLTEIEEDIQREDEEIAEKERLASLSPEEWRKEKTPALSALVDKPRGKTAVERLLDKPSKSRLQQLREKTIASQPKNLERLTEAFRDVSDKRTSSQEQNRNRLLEALRGEMVDKPAKEQMGKEQHKQAYDRWQDKLRRDEFNQAFDEATDENERRDMLEAQRREREERLGPASRAKMRNVQGDAAQMVFDAGKELYDTGKEKGKELYGAGKEKLGRWKEQLKTSKYTPGSDKWHQKRFEQEMRMMGNVADQDSAIQRGRERKKKKIIDAVEQKKKIMDVAESERPQGWRKTIRSLDRKIPINWEKKFGAEGEALPENEAEFKMPTRDLYDWREMLQRNKKQVMRQSDPWHKRKLGEFKRKYGLRERIPMQEVPKSETQEVGDWKEGSMGKPAPKDGELSPDGQWKYSATEGDWVSNAHERAVDPTPDKTPEEKEQQAEEPEEKEPEEELTISDETTQPPKETFAEEEEKEEMKPDEPEPEEQS